MHIGSLIKKRVLYLLFILKREATYFNKATGNTLCELIVQHHVFLLSESKRLED